MPSIYNTVIQELLVQQHLIRYNKKYQYDEVRSGCSPKAMDRVNLFYTVPLLNL